MMLIVSGDIVTFLTVRGPNGSIVAEVVLRQCGHFCGMRTNKGVDITRCCLDQDPRVPRVLCHICGVRP